MSGERAIASKLFTFPFLHSPATVPYQLCSSVPSFDLFDYADASTATDTRPP